MTKTYTLTAGQKYDADLLCHAGWTRGDGSGHQGYHFTDYFGADGTYLGPDRYGIEPLVEDWIVTEAGTGLPSAGDEVLIVNDGNVQRLAVIATTGSIQTGQPGQGNWMVVTLSAAERDWDDLDEAEQDRLYEDLHHV